MKHKKSLGNRLRPLDWNIPRLEQRRIRKQRVAGVMLDPLAEVGIGMLMTVLVRCGQFVVYFQRYGKRSQRQQHTGQRQRQCRPQNTAGERSCQHTHH